MVIKECTEKPDIVKNDIGETVIDYNAQESFAQRIKREQVDPSAEYRKSNYRGDTIEQGVVQNQQVIATQEVNKDNELEL